MSDLPSVEETSEALKWFGVGRRIRMLSDDAYRLKVLAEIARAFVDGRLVPVSRFVCPRCDGSGEVWDSECCPDGATCECEMSKCPSCEGSGWVFPDDLIETVRKERRNESSLVR